MRVSDGNGTRLFSARTTVRLVLFSLAMAFVESAVVVYLRGLYYPDGFRLPLRAIPTDIYLTEIGREAATIVMLWAVAALTARRPLRRFLVFSFCFAVWDIGYYLWLKLLLGWPGSLLSTDILFLIPLPWVAPVLAPLIVSICLIVGALALDRLSDTLPPPGAAAVIAGILGGLLVIGSFLSAAPAPVRAEPPAGFRWPLFGAGMLVAAGGLYLWMRRRRSRDA